MASTINTNVNSLTAQRNLSMSQSSLSTSMQRLSSGLRINSAKDDAAGLAISDRFTAQIRGLNQAARNANDAISLSQTAEGALGSITNNLQRIRELAVQSANGTNSASDRAAIQNEVKQLSDEIGRVAAATQFNGTNLLDGTLSNTSFQVGANAGQTIAFSVGSAKATDIGSNQIVGQTATGSISAAVAGTTNNSTAQTTLQISAQGVTTAAIATTAKDTGKTIAAAINAATPSTGVTAKAVTTATISGVGLGAATFTLTSGGNNGAVNAAVSIAATITDTKDLSALAVAVNAQSSTTGITAVSDKNGNLVLTDTTGNDINVSTTDVAVGVGMVAAKLAGTETTGVTIGAAGATSVTVGAAVTLSSKAGFTVLAATGTDLFATGSSASTINSVANVDVSTVTGANNALETVDAALANISDQRAKLGAVQNRFESTVTNLQTSSENLSASRSRIQDADFAAETANLSRSQILQQAGTAMVAQANQLPQGVLALLR